MNSTILALRQHAITKRTYSDGFNFNNPDIVNALEGVKLTSAIIDYIVENISSRSEQLILKTLTNNKIYYLTQLNVILKHFPKLELKLKLGNGFRLDEMIEGMSIQDIENLIASNIEIYDIRPIMKKITSENLLEYLQLFIKYPSSSIVMGVNIAELERNFPNVFPDRFKQKAIESGALFDCYEYNEAEVVKACKINIEAIFALTSDQILNLYEDYNEFMIEQNMMEPFYFKGLRRDPIYSKLININNTKFRINNDGPCSCTCKITDDQYDVCHICYDFGNEDYSHFYDEDYDHEKYKQILSRSKGDDSEKLKYIVEKRKKREAAKITDFDEFWQFLRNDVRIVNWIKEPKWVMLDDIIAGKDNKVLKYILNKISNARVNNMVLKLATPYESWYMVRIFVNILAFHRDLHFTFI